MTPFEVVYERFLNTVSIDFGDLSEDDIAAELFNWTVTASSYFKFPRVSLSYEIVAEIPQFKEDLSDQEITVIVEYMKLTQLERELLDSNRYEAYYEDANLKLPSQTATITQLNRSLENQRAIARRVEHDYYRTENYQPTIGEVWKR